MQTVLTPRKPRQAKPKPPRFISLKLKPFEAEPGVWQPGVVNIKVGKEPADSYYILPLNSAWGRAFRLEKFTGLTAETYHVNLDLAEPEKKSTCECLGFLRWKKPCKHIDGLLKLVREGKLPGSEPAPAVLPTDPDMLTGPAWDPDHFLDIAYVEYLMAQGG